MWAGIHWVEWSEFKERYGTNLKRVRMIQGLEAAMEALKVAGCRAIYINGSFVTSEPNPNDFDACWDRDEVDIDYLRTNAPIVLNFYNREAQKAKYKGDIFPSDQLVDDEGKMCIDFFQGDRNQNPKGIIAIDLFRWEP
ncbi:MAG TPA: hypothetical protein DCL61_13360 [Cyanobacteria bacterium UBA12227]|nr:hypothetical protein [Cyanobacteria bacterium UBA12227]HAX86693.1 hypothetical protein [Cyanobacteria bacterium UBA11370]HBY77099.1 hypothetical protein [Cyanobacteria bacterium UBA11148]